jgi:hypothetical protein
LQVDETKKYAGAATLCLKMADKLADRKFGSSNAKWQPRGLRSRGHAAEQNLTKNLPKSELRAERLSFCPARNATAKADRLPQLALLHVSKIEQSRAPQDKLADPGRSRRLPARSSNI